MAKVKVEIHEALLEITDDIGNPLFSFEIKDNQLQILNSSGFTSFDNNIAALEEMRRVTVLFRDMLS